MLEERKTRWLGRWMGGCTDGWVDKCHLTVYLHLSQCSVRHREVLSQVLSASDFHLKKKPGQKPGMRAA